MFELTLANPVIVVLPAARVVETLAKPVTVTLPVAVVFMLVRFLVSSMTVVPEILIAIFVL
jgi:hypothetical protein